MATSARFDTHSFSFCSFAIYLFFFHSHSHFFSHFSRFVVVFSCFFCWETECVVQMNLCSRTRINMLWIWVDFFFFCFELKSLKVVLDERKYYIWMESKSSFSFVYLHSWPTLLDGVVFTTILIGLYILVWIQKLSLPKDACIKSD